MNPTRQELEFVMKELDELIEKLLQEERELNNLTAFIASMPKEARDRAVESTSSAKAKRAMAEPIGGDEYENTALADADAKRVMIGRIWLKINELQTRKAVLEANEGK